MANKGQTHHLGTCVGLSTRVTPSTHPCLPTAHQELISSWHHPKAQGLALLLQGKAPGSPLVTSQARLCWPDTGKELAAQPLSWQRALYSGGLSCIYNLFQGDLDP